MRFPFTKIYRAFPELDNYRDDQCERFVAAARGRWGQRLVRLILAIAVAIVSQAVMWALIVYATNSLRTPQARSTIDLSSGGEESGALAAVAGLLLLFPITLIGFLPAIFLRDRMLLGQIRRVLIERGFCIKCHYSLIGLPVTERKFIMCLDCEKPVILKGTEPPVCPSCHEKLEETPQSEWVVVCAECGTPGLVDSSLSELTINAETSTLKAADN